MLKCSPDLSFDKIKYEMFIFCVAPEDAANFVMELSGFLRELSKSFSCIKF